MSSNIYDYFYLFGKKLKNLQIEIGNRLKEIRTQYYSKHKLSVADFAEELSESKFNIANYERGIANVPNRILATLYDKGFNPTYIITGEGSIFADNEAGRSRMNVSNIISVNKTNNIDISEQIKEAMKAVAGDLANILRNENIK